MTLIDLLAAPNARHKQAGFSFGHGATKAYDEPGWRVLWVRRQPLDYYP